MNAELAIAIKNLKIIIDDLDKCASNTAAYNTEWALRIEDLSYELYKQASSLVELEYIFNLTQNFTS